jgi:hypothetical protein
MNQSWCSSFLFGCSALYRPQGRIHSRQSYKYTSFCFDASEYFLFRASLASPTGSYSVSQSQHWHRAFFMTFPCTHILVQLTYNLSSFRLARFFSVRNRLIVSKSFGSAASRLLVRECTKPMRLQGLSPSSRTRKNFDAKD